MNKKFGNVELVIENDKITNVLLNGKPVKKMYIRGLKKAQETNFWLLFDEDNIATNYNSGVQRELNGFEFSLYNWCMNWYQKYSYGDLVTPIQTFDDMKYLLMEINSDAYYDFID